jgi:gliding motility-associated-like protein
MKIYLQILFLLLFAFDIQAQEPPVLESLKVDINGNVTLNWSMFPIDPSLQNFEIHFSENGSSFISIAAVSNSTFSYTHNGADADNGIKWYYIKAIYDQGDINSETLQTIYLQVDNNQPDFNRADLYWNALSNLLPDGYSSYYKIMREYPLGNWVLHDSVPVDSLHYAEEIIVCYDSINYQVFIETVSGDTSFSNIRGAIFSDEFYPDPLINDSISVDQNNLVTLGWNPSENGDVVGYIIYLYDETDSDYYNYDTIYGRFNSSYTDSIANPCERSFSFAVAAFDSCFNKGQGTFSPQRFTIFLEPIDYNACERTNTLTWSAYQASSDLNAYNIYYSKNEGSFLLAGQNEPDLLSFVHENIEPGFTYTYYVQALFDGRSSSSCKKKVTAFNYQLPSFVYFANADVLPSENIELTIEVDTGVKYATWNIFRNDPQSINFNQIASLNGANISESPIVYMDETADPNLGQYIYYVEVLDSCNKLTLGSNENKTIFLTVENTNINFNQLQWTSFEGWDAGIEKYYVFRILDGVEPESPIDSVDAQTLEYTDDISLLESTGSILYWIQALEKEGNSFGFKMRANSNRSGVAVASEMFLPTAFRPGGYTPEFKPVYRFYSADNYLLQIYNRWGQLIFETSNPETGWDGSFKGKIVSQGVYIYKLVYQNSDLSSVEKRGTFTVIY